MKNRNRLAARAQVRPLVSLSVLSAAALVSLAPQTVCAQQPGTAASAQQSIAFHIPAQPLAHALNRFSQQSRHQVLFDQQVVAGHTAPAVQGSYLPRQALNLLLAGTGLQVNDSVPGAFTVLRANRSSSADGALPEVVVAASSGYAPGELPPAYAGGQVASGSRIGMLGNKDFMETPFATISYTSDAIANRQTDNAFNIISETDAAVQNMGSDNAFYSRNGSGLMVRGFGAAPTDFSFNGLQGVGSSYLSNIGIFAERVEVLKGPSALLSGMRNSGNVGGTINVVTKRAPDEPLTRLTAGYSSDALWRGHTDIGRRFGTDNRFGIRINAARTVGDTAISQQKRHDTVLGTALDFRSERVRLSADIMSSRAKVDGADPGISLNSNLTAVPAPPDADTLFGGNPWTIHHSRDLSVALKAEVDITEQTSAYISTGRSRSELNSILTQYTVSDPS